MLTHISSCCLFADHRYLSSSKVETFLSRVLENYVHLYTPSRNQRTFYWNMLSTYKFLVLSVLIISACKWVEIFRHKLNGAPWTLDAIDLEAFLYLCSK
jgi:hypothetical protein